MPKADVDRYIREFEVQLSAWLERRKASRLPSGIWFENEVFSLFVRDSRRVRPDRNVLVRCLDFATVGVQPAYQRLGICSRLIEIMDRLNPFDAIYVENVLEPSQYGIYERRGFKGLPGYPGGLAGEPKSFWRDNASLEAKAA